MTQLRLYPARLKYCTAFSCCFAFSIVLNVPRFLRLPVLVSFLREYKRYSPDFSLRITSFSYSCRRWDSWLARRVARKLRSDVAAMESLFLSQSTQQTRVIGVLHLTNV